jgi:hypothetical protein
METINQLTGRLLELLGHNEEPYGVYYSDVKPMGFGPKPGEIFSREREEAGLINWRHCRETFCCFFRNIWLVRQKGQAAWLSHEECGCMGGGFFTGIYGPYLEFGVSFVSTGDPQAHVEGEHYLPSKESMRTFLADITPPKASGKYCVLMPLKSFNDDNPPLTVTFFARPEVLSGLYSLAMYATGDHNCVVTPFGPGCGGILAWPIVYKERGLEKAVIGGFDISARKFMNADELTFSVTLDFYRKMLAVIEPSALTRHTWALTRKKVLKSDHLWSAAKGGSAAA